MVGALSEEDLDFLDSLEDAFKAYSKLDRVEEMPLVMQVEKVMFENIAAVSAARGHGD